MSKRKEKKKKRGMQEKINKEKKKHERLRINRKGNTNFPKFLISIKISTTNNLR